MEAIATLHVPEAAKADAAHQRVQHFITDSRWDDHAVRLQAARYALAAMTQVASVWVWNVGYLPETYGNSSQFRDGVRKLKLDFAAAINATTTVWVVNALGRRNGTALSVSAFAQNAAVRGQFRRISWREGTQETLSARFAFARVVPVRDDGRDPRRRERLWLVCEWRDGEDRPAHFYFATYRRAPYGLIVHQLKERWRTERFTRT